MGEKEQHFSLLHQQFLTRTASLLRPKVPPCIDKETSIKRVFEILQEDRTEALLIVDANNEPTGIFTERDAILKIATNNIDIEKTPVSQVMTRKPETVRLHTSIARMLYMLSQGGFRHLPIVDRYHKVAGMISVKNVLDFLSAALTKKVVEDFPILIGEESRVQTFLTSNVDIISPPEPVKVNWQDSVETTLIALKNSRRGSCTVTDSLDRVVGIYTERDYILRTALTGIDISNTKISRLMTEDPKTVDSTTTVSYALNMMCEGGYRHIPVTDENDHAFAILSVKAFVDHLARSIILDLGTDE